MEQVTTKIKEVKESTFYCDICGKEIPTRDFSADGKNYEYIISSVAMQIWKTNYPEYQDGKTFEPDICSDCMLTKVIPRIQELLKDGNGWEDFCYC